MAQFASETEPGPPLDTLLPWSGSGTMPGRTWVRAPSPDVLRRRWRYLIEAPTRRKPGLLAEHPRDRTVDTVLSDNLPGYPATRRPIREETQVRIEPFRIAFRSFDRQWLIPDKRVINQPNPALWWTRSDQQTYLTASHDRTPTAGPAATISALVPDLHHYHGRGGRAFPFWRDPDASTANITPGLFAHLASVLGQSVTAEELFAYVAGILVNPAYTQRFADELTTPGLRVPLTADPQTFAAVVETGRRVIWLHSFGKRYVDAAADRPPRPPRLPDHRRPRVKVAIPAEPGRSPDRIDYRPDEQQLLIGEGVIAPVEPAVWDYEVSGMRVLRHWFGYRKREPEGRRSSPLDDLTHDTWDPSWTTELLEIINVLTLLTDLEDEQANQLDQILAGPLIAVDELIAAGILQPDRTGRPTPPKAARTPPKVPRAEQQTLGTLGIAAEDRPS